MYVTMLKTFEDDDNEDEDHGEGPTDSVVHLWMSISPLFGPYDPAVPGCTWYLCVS